LLRQLHNRFAALGVAGDGSGAVNLAAHKSGDGSVDHAPMRPFVDVVAGRHFLRHSEQSGKLGMIADRACAPRRSALRTRRIGSGDDLSWLGFAGRVNGNCPDAIRCEPLESRGARRRLTARHSAIHDLNEVVAKIGRESLCHVGWPLSPTEALNQDAIDLEIPIDSIRSKTAPNEQPAAVKPVLKAALSRTVSISGTHPRKRRAHAFKPAGGVVSAAVALMLHL
jgi:hypothetical protein